jgi:hypothetical protein
MEKRIIEYLTKSDLIKHDARDIAEGIQATTSSEFTEFSKCLNKLSVILFVLSIKTTIHFIIIRYIR